MKNEINEREILEHFIFNIYFLLLQFWTEFISVHYNNSTLFSKRYSRCKSNIKYHSGFPVHKEFNRANLYLTFRAVSYSRNTQETQNIVAN